VRNVKTTAKNKRVSGQLEKIVAAPKPNIVADAITPEESERRAQVKRIFEEIDVLRLRTKKFPKGVTIDSLIEEGRKY
jgi:hypothetical protein